MVVFSAWYNNSIFLEILFLYPTNTAGKEQYEQLLVFWEATSLNISWLNCVILVTIYETTRHTH